jgi:hypothetical protein
MRLLFALFVALAAALPAAAGPDDPVPVWVFFTDKGSSEVYAAAVPRDVVSERSVARRLKVRPAAVVVDRDDLSLEEEYVRAVTDRVTRLRQRSRWFNAVSVLATPAQIGELRRLHFVRAVEEVARWRRDSARQEIFTPAPPAESVTLSPDSISYGSSYGQLQQINVPAVHATGNHAQSVMIAVFDNGFRLPNHQAFDSMTVLATYDFVDNKVSVVPNNPSSSFGAHGVNTLSTIGGYRPGQLVGPAFGAQYLLVRSENDSSETPVEEDYWVAGIEWADSIGVDVTSTSLGYLTYDAPFTSWTWEDMDGNTTLITRAADMAAGRGILVLNSAGNNGANASRNTLNAPADGDSVVAVGAVTSSGARSSFSSVGPSTSIPPRIKPEIMAQGSSVYVASATNPSGYGYSSGTSFSCPLAAGAAALILHAHPSATPMEILDAMKATASNSSSPNNQFGWGIINTAAAIAWLTANDAAPSEELPVGMRLEQNYPNPFNPSTTIPFTLPAGGRVRLTVHDLLGRTTAVLVDGERGAGSHTAVWDGRTNSGMPVAGGTYMVRLRTETGASATRMMLFLK